MNVYKRDLGASIIKVCEGITRTESKGSVRQCPPRWTKTWKKVPNLFKLRRVTRTTTSLLRKGLDTRVSTVEKPNERTESENEPGTEVPTPSTVSR